MKRVIGITGGVGAGKSRVLEILREGYGAEIILADDVAKELMEPGKEGFIQVVKALGEGILAPDGSFDRGKLAELLFSDGQARGMVNSIIHPMTWAEIARRVQASDKALIAVESALMGPEQRGQYQEIWYVSVPRQTRVARLMESRGYSRKRCEDMMESQASEEEFLALCDRVIDNSGDLSQTKEEIRRALQGDRQRKERG